MDKKKKRYAKPEVIKIPVNFKQMVRNLTGGGFCPYVFVWNGREYIKENNILPLSENLARREKVVSDRYVLNTVPQEHNGYLNIKINEADNEVSWLNYFKLEAMEHPEDYKLGITTKGETVTYNTPQKPFFCRDKQDRDCLGLITNDHWLNPDKFYTTQPGDELELDFGEVKSRDLKLIIVDPKNAYAAPCEIFPPHEFKSIHIYLWLKDYQKIDILHTREEFYPDVVDLTPYLDQIKGKLKFRLEFTARHKVSFVGIDTTPPVQMERKVYSLIQATHTEFGDVTDILKQDDDKSVRLYPGETIELKFPVPAPAKPGNKLSYVLFSKGYYIPTTKMLSLAKAGAVTAE